MLHIKKLLVAISLVAHAHSLFCMNNIMLYDDDVYPYKYLQSIQPISFDKERSITPCNQVIKPTEHVPKPNRIIKKFCIMNGDNGETIFAFPITTQDQETIHDDQVPPIDCLVISNVFNILYGRTTRNTVA